MSEDTPRGYYCETCSEWHEFLMYVFAHMSDELKHTCEMCGAVHSILNGVASQVKPGSFDPEESE